MRSIAAIVAAGVAGMAVCLAAAPGHALAATAPSADDCAAMAAPGRLAGLTVASARSVAGSDNAPAFCEIAAAASPAPGSHIGEVFRFPYNWNGKLVGLGGGGWAGTVRVEAAMPALRQGYAVLQTDGGHPNPNPGDASWMITAPGKPNEPAVTDFSRRAVHSLAADGKAAVKAFYGRAQSRAYFQGCSTGGRMGMMETQRFPDDYDGVVIGDPVLDLVVQTTALVRTQVFHKDPQSNLAPEQLPAINKAVLAACDKLDGAVDGLISNPGACRWDPAVLQCKPGETGTCLTAKQVATVRNAYKGYTTRDGRVVAWPLSRGGELGWLDRSVGTPREPLGSNAVTGSRGIQYLVYADPDFDLNAWDPEAGLAHVRGSAVARTYEATDPDISAFVARGGKAIFYHGGYDPGPSPLGTVAYYQAATRALGPAAASKGVRLFLVPGMFHCTGGPGPDQFDMLSALDQWMETGVAPASVPAHRADNSLSRPLCPYPEQAAYVGGDVSLAGSFRCRK